MMTIKMNTSKIYLYNLSYEGMDVIFHEYEKFLDEVNSKVNMIGDRYSKVNLFNIDFIWSRFDNSDIVIYCDDENWNMSIEDKIKLYS